MNLFILTFTSFKPCSVTLPTVSNHPAEQTHYTYIGKIVKADERVSGDSLYVNSVHTSLSRSRLHTHLQPHPIISL